MRSDFAYAPGYRSNTRCLLAIQFLLTKEVAKSEVILEMLYTGDGLKHGVCFASCRYQRHSFGSKRQSHCGSLAKDRVTGAETC